LQSTAPVWRSNEPDWYAAMQRPLDEVKKLQEICNCPIFCAGDVFNHWDSSAELINWAIEHLPPILAIPGQHDIPNHNLKDIHRSAFRTLALAERIFLLKTNRMETFPGMVVASFDYGQKMTPCVKNIPFDPVKIAIAHEYRWIQGHSYPNAPLESKLSEVDYLGYNTIIFGDNHSGFTTEIGRTTIFNCGCLIRRKSDEVDYKPQVGLILRTGKVLPYYLDTSKDKYLKIADDIIETEDFNMKEFITELEKLGDSALDFNEAMKQYFEKHKTDSSIRKVIIKAMEK
jgi:DNA repair exonuclease SbcCD nuclease subunit